MPVADSAAPIGTVPVIPDVTVRVVPLIDHVVTVAPGEGTTVVVVAPVIEGTF
jgi:hypothetical protein